MGWHVLRLWFSVAAAGPLISAWYPCTPRPRVEPPGPSILKPCPFDLPDASFTQLRSVFCMFPCRVGFLLPGLFCLVPTTPRSSLFFLPPLKFPHSLSHIFSALTCHSGFEHLVPNYIQFEVHSAFLIPIYTVGVDDEQFYLFLLILQEMERFTFGSCSILVSLTFWEREFVLFWGLLCTL